MNRNTAQLKDDWKPIGKQKALAEWMNQVSRFFNNFTVIRGGQISLSQDGMTLRCTGSASCFSSTYYFKGKLYELTGDQKAYWYHNAATGSGSWSDGPAPDPMPDSMYFRKTSSCNSIEYIMC